MADGISNLESKSTPLPKQSVELIRATLEDMRKHGLMSGLPQEHAFTLLEEIERLTNDVALLQMLQQTMEECIGVTEAQSFEARAEELMVTEAQHKQCSAVETTAPLSEADEVQIGQAQAELAVLKKNGRSYEVRRIAGQALEVITRLHAARGTFGEIAQLRRIDKAVRVYVEDRTHGNYSKLCDALFDGRPAVEPSEQRTCLGCGQPYPCPSDCPAGTIVSVTK